MPSARRNGAIACRIASATVPSPDVWMASVAGPGASRPRTASWILPFEALYQTALSEITADTFGFTRYAIDLGPFGGAQEFGGFLWVFTVLYLGAIALVSLWAFRRRDL